MNDIGNNMSMGMYTNNDYPKMIIGETKLDNTEIGTTTIGHYNQVSGRKSICVGSDCKISKSNSINIGNNNDVKGNNSVCLGNNNDVKGNNSVCLGNDITVDGDNKIMICEIDLRQLVSRVEYLEEQLEKILWMPDGYMCKQLEESFREKCVKMEQHRNIN